MKQTEKGMYSAVISDEKLPPLVYGLKGIMEVFQVSKSTAHKYRHGILAAACTQNGKKIIVDTRKALELYSNNSSTKIVEEI